ncbi:hypothetical protein WN943_009893 [Citrus x changshan-huyou]
MAYIYQAKVKKNGLHYHCIWGKFQGLMETELGSSCTPAISKVLQPLDVGLRLSTTWKESLPFYLCYKLGLNSCVMEPNHFCFIKMVNETLYSLKLMSDLFAPAVSISLHIWVIYMVDLKLQLVWTNLFDFSGCMECSDFMGEAESHEPAPSVHGSNSCFVSTLCTFSCKGSSGICYSTQRSPILLTLPTF